MGRKATERKGYSKSRGQTALASAVASAFPLAVVKQDATLRRYVDRDLGYPWRVLEREYGRSLGRLDADVLLLGPEPALLEYHGRQHFEFVQHFHGDREGWLAAQERDNQKVWLSQRLGIPLVVFRYDENPTPDLVVERLEEARLGMVPLPGYVACSACGRRFLPCDMEGGCPDCRREAKLDERRARQAEAMAGRKPSEEERQRAREARRAERERSRTLAAALNASPEAEARREAARRRQRESRREAKDRLGDVGRNPEAAREAKERAAEIRKRIETSPEAMARKAESAQRRREAARAAREAAKAAAAESGRDEEAKAAAREARAAAKERAKERLRQEKNTPEAARRSAEIKSRQAEIRARQRESSERYRESEEGQRRAEEARVRRKEAYRAAKEAAKNRAAGGDG